MDYQAELINFKPEHEFFIGIDSDGCVFDSMEVKQKEFFIPNALKHFKLFPISRILRETWEFVNLYSIYRGGNRFTSLLKVFELLRDRDELKETGFKLPDLTPLSHWVRSEKRLSNANLWKYFEKHYSPELEMVVRWTEAVNEDIAKWLRDIPPFPHAFNSIRSIAEKADLIIVSQTPLEALVREWKEADMNKHIRIIAGQEHGTKTDHIALAANGRYSPEKILMVGDAKGDLDAARNNGVLFYPIIPGNESKSWDRFLNEGSVNFFNGNYRGEYEKKLLKDFINSLPEKPHWKK